jgi:hypothetical protein
MFTIHVKKQIFQAVPGRSTCLLTSEPKVLWVVIFFFIIFLTFIVCEGVLGLSILVSLIRTHGNDYF